MLGSPAAHGQTPAAARHNGRVVNQESGRERLREIARRAMLERGLLPEFSKAALDQARAAAPPQPDGVRDLRALLWSSIDNDDTRDLDQLEVAEPRPDGSVGLKVAIADVDALVARE